MKAVATNQLVQYDECSSMAALRALPVPSSGAARKAHVTGYYTPGDGGGDHFWYDFASTLADDGGMTFRPSGVSTGNPGRWRRITDLGIVYLRQYGAIGDGTSHPLSGFFSTLTAAQAVYPHATALTNEVDWCAIQAAVNYLKAPYPNAYGYFSKGGAICVSKGSFLCDQPILCDITGNISFEGVSGDGGGGGYSTAGSGLVYTGNLQYVNESNTGAFISARSSQGFAMRRVNVMYTSATYTGHLVDFSHFGGNTIARVAPLPTLTFSGTTITRNTGSFLNDGWLLGMIVCVRSSASNDSLQGTITGITATVITAAATAWTSETSVSTALLYSSSSDTGLPTLEDLTLSGGPAIYVTAGQGARALVSLSGAIDGRLMNVGFTVAQGGILFQNGIGGYSNAHLVVNPVFTFLKYSMMNSGQDCTIIRPTVEGSGGVMEAAYIDLYPFTEANPDVALTFSHSAQTITRSTGSWIADGWADGMVANVTANIPINNATTGAGGGSATAGTVTSVTTTVLTLSVAPMDESSTYVYTVFDDDALNGAGVQTTSQHGNTLTFSGTTITRSDGGSFIADGWLIGYGVYGVGDGTYGTVASLTDSTLTLAASVGSLVMTSGYIRIPYGGGPFNVIGGWMGDEYVSTTWFQTLGAAGLNLHGVFIEGGQGLLHARGDGASGTISGCSVAVSRPRQACLFDGVNGAGGFTVTGTPSCGVRDRAVNPSPSLVMQGNGSFVTTSDTVQIIDDAWAKYIMRLKSGLRLTTVIAPTGVAATSLLEVDGAIATISTTLSANTTLTNAHSHVWADTVTSGAITLTLPDATLCPGREYTIKHKDGANNATVATTSSQTIDGASTYVLSVINQAVTLKSNGTAWAIIAKVGEPTGVTPGSYSSANITVSADGRVTAAASGSGVGGGSGALIANLSHLAQAYNPALSGGDYTVGVEIIPTAAMTLTGIQFYWGGGGAGTVRATLWLSGTAVAHVDVTVGSGSGVHTGTFGSGQALTVGNGYWVTIRESTGTNFQGPLSSAQCPAFPYFVGAEMFTTQSGYSTGTAMPGTILGGGAYPVAPVYTVP